MPLLALAQQCPDDQTPLVAAMGRVQGWGRVQGGLLELMQELLQVQAAPLPSLPEAVQHNHDSK